MEDKKVMQPVQYFGGPDDAPFPPPWAQESPAVQEPEGDEEAAEPAAVTDLMTALQDSVAKAKADRADSGPTPPKAGPTPGPTPPKPAA